MKRCGWGMILACLIAGGIGAAIPWGKWANATIRYIVYPACPLCGTPMIEVHSITVPCAGCSDGLKEVRRATCDNGHETLEYPR